MNKTLVFKKVCLVLLMQPFSLCMLLSAVDILDLVKPYLPENPIILEAGAFDGRDSLRMARFWPQGHIHAFEPVPDLFKPLGAIASLARNITFYPVALGDTVGIAPMYLSAYDTAPDIISASSSLLPPKDHLIHAPEVLFNKSVSVNVTTIDKWAQEHGIDHVDFMWLDMQGGELPALKHSLAKILPGVKVILVEVEFVQAYAGQALFDEVKSFLEEHGFRFFGLVSNYGWCGDALFIR